MSLHQFGNCGRTFCIFSSINLLKLLNSYSCRKMTLPRLIGLRQCQNNMYHNSKSLNSTRNTRIFQYSTFYGLQSHIVGPVKYNRGLQTWFTLRKTCKGFSRNFSSSQKYHRQRNKTTAIYIIALVTVVLGGSYAAVPLYRMFCQASGLGGTVQQADAGEKIKNMKAKKERLITVRFNADKSATMQWSFKPQQTEVKVYPGETALAFYTAKNPTDVPITGISTYNVIPFEAGQYFNKIQCFCFEEQRLNPHEQVDMPVFFYIDPEFTEDPALYKVDTITLSYTFFQAKEAQDLGIQ